MNKKSLNALESLIDYLWLDEEKNYEEVGRPKEGHIFLAIRELNDYLANMEKSEMNKKDWIDKNLSNLENQESEEFAELVEEYEILFNGADLMEDLELYYA